MFHFLNMRKFISQQVIKCGNTVSQQSINFGALIQNVSVNDYCMFLKYKYVASFGIERPFTFQDKKYETFGDWENEHKNYYENLKFIDNKITTGCFLLGVGIGLYQADNIITNKTKKYKENNWYMQEYEKKDMFTSAAMQVGISTCVGVFMAFLYPIAIPLSVPCYLIHRRWRHKMD